MIKMYETRRSGLDSLTPQDDLSLVSFFCAKYSAKLVKILPNDENFPPSGEIYVFDDNLGGYSIEGIRRSLIEEHEGDNL